MVEIRLQNGESREFERVEMDENGTVFAFAREGEFPHNRYPLQAVYPPGAVLEIGLDEDAEYDTTEDSQILSNLKYRFNDENPEKK